MLMKSTTAALSVFFYERPLNELANNKLRNTTQSNWLNEYAPFMMAVNP